VVRAEGAEATDAPAARPTRMRNQEWLNPHDGKPRSRRAYRAGPLGRTGCAKNGESGRGRKGGGPTRDIRAMR
jgi:hypothetical protein